MVLCTGVPLLSGDTCTLSCTSLSIGLGTRAPWPLFRRALDRFRGCGHHNRPIMMPLQPRRNRSLDRICRNLCGRVRSFKKVSGYDRIGAWRRFPDFAGGADIPSCGTVKKPGQAMDRTR